MDNYIPDRKDIVWIDFNLQKSGEIGKYKSVLILSSRQYSQKTGLIICSPISTNIRGAAFEVAIDVLDKSLVVVSTIINTLKFKERRIEFIDKCNQEVFNEVLYKLLPIIGATEIIKNENN